MEQSLQQPELYQVGQTEICPRSAARELQEECRQILTDLPTTSREDQQILDSNPKARRTREAAIKYRLHRKLFLEKVIQALEMYQDRILF